MLMLYIVYTARTEQGRRDRMWLLLPSGVVEKKGEKKFVTPYIVDTR